jgi:hypothetical protein
LLGRGAKLGTARHHKSRARDKLPGKARRGIQCKRTRRKSLPLPDGCRKLRTRHKSRSLGDWAGTWLPLERVLPIRGQRSCGRKNRKRSQLHGRKTAGRKHPRKPKRAVPGRRKPDRPKPGRIPAECRKPGGCHGIHRRARIRKPRMRRPRRHGDRPLRVRARRLKLHRTRVRPWRRRRKRGPAVCVRRRG